MTADHTDAAETAALFAPDARKTGLTIDEVVAQFAARKETK